VTYHPGHVCILTDPALARIIVLHVILCAANRAGSIMSALAGAR